LPKRFFNRAGGARPPLCPRPALWLAFAAMIAMAGLPSARAYVLTGPHVLELMIERLGKVRGIEARQHLILYDERLPDGQATLDETVRYRLPQAFRSDITGDGTRRTHLRTGGSVVTVVDHRLAGEPETGFDFYKDLLLYRDRKLLEKRLARRGVDVTTSSLGRFEDRIAIVLGAQYPDDTLPQIWFDKETFLPMRWLIRDPAAPQKKALEIQYHDWGKSGAVHYPARILFLEDGQRVREMQVQKLIGNPEFAPGLFDIEGLKAMAAAVDMAPETNEKEQEIQKTIEDFKKLYE
jgi:hypothetical protein